MKKIVVPLIALVIGIAAALAGFNSMKRMNTGSGSLIDTEVIGEIQSLKGDVQSRPPGSVRSEPAKAPHPLHAQEWIVTGSDSEAVLSFNIGSVFRLAADSRMVAELDAMHPDSLLITLQSGDISVLNPGPQGKTRIYRNGREYRPISGNTSPPMVPLIRAGTSNAPAATAGTPAAGASEGTPAPLVIATSPAEETAATPAGTPPRTLPKYKVGSKDATDTLSNEDIARQLKMQTSFFQRCYLTFINRTKPGTGAGEKQAAGPTGTIDVGFTIQPTGRVNNAHVVRSDFNDPTLHKCVTEVVERTPFKAFGSSAITVEDFPIALQ